MRVLRELLSSRRIVIQVTEKFLTLYVLTNFSSCFPQIFCQISTQFVGLCLVIGFQRTYIFRKFLTTEISRRRWGVLADTKINGRNSCKSGYHLICLCLHVMSLKIKKPLDDTKNTTFILAINQGMAYQRNKRRWYRIIRL